MEENNNMKLSLQGFTDSIKALNAGHKRLWGVVSIIWVLVFMIPSGLKYIENVQYCDTVENDYMFRITGLELRTYKLCNVKVKHEKWKDLKGKDRTTKVYKIYAKYNTMPILWAATLPLGLPLLMFLVMWIRSGYKADDL